MNRMFSLKENKIIISHRGNIFGSDPNTENHPDQITKALSLGFDVEVDVWWRDGMYFLGHDFPAHSVSLEFLQQPGIWCHAKSPDSLNFLLDDNIHCFWHENDKCTLTSEGFIWAYPNNPIKNSILVALEEYDSQIHSSLKDIRGICTDYPLSWSKYIQIR